MITANGSDLILSLSRFSRSIGVSVVHLHNICIAAPVTDCR
jgi:hypothetical protein